MTNIVEQLCQLILNLDFPQDDVNKPFLNVF